MVRKTVSRVIYSIPTKAECSSHNTSTDATEHQSADVVNTVNFSMAKLKDANYIVRPRRNHGNSNEADDTRYKAQGVEGSWDGEDTKTNLGLHHKDGRSSPSYLADCQFMQDHLACHLHTFR